MWSQTRMTSAMSWSTSSIVTLKRSRTRRSRSASWAVSLVASQRRAEGVGQHAPRGAGVDRHHEVLQRRQAREQLQVLERAGQPQAGPAMGRERAQLMAVEGDGAGVGIEDAAHAVEERRLPGAVGP